jgi:hypothetical protein
VAPQPEGSSDEDVLRGRRRRTEPYEHQQVNEVTIGVIDQDSELEDDPNLGTYHFSVKNQPVVGKGQAYRQKNALHKTVDFQPYISICQSMIVQLSDLTKSRIYDLYPQEYEAMMKVIDRAFTHNENTSLLVTARSKQIIHSILSQAVKEQSEKLARDEKDLRVVRVNTTLFNANETRMLAKFMEVLDLQARSKELYTVEMITEIQNFFEANKDVCLLLIFEDIDFYIQETKQGALYKILDMLQYCQTKFVFIAATMKHNIVDLFEKRIKSRFSHRNVLCYDVELDKFTQLLSQLFESLNAKSKHKFAVEIQTIRDLVLSGASRDILEEAVSNGK